MKTNNCPLLLTGEYCSEPGEVENGFYMCKPNTCDLYKVGTEVDFICSKDHEPRPNDVMSQICKSDGQWSAKKPMCAPGENSYDICNYPVCS